MSRHGWKGVERTAAALVGLKRHKANTGDRLDAGGRREDLYAVQVKNPKRMSLASIEALAIEMRDIAFKGPHAPQIGLVMVKRSARRPTPHLVIMTDDVWLAVRNHLLGAEAQRRGA